MAEVTECPECGGKLRVPDEMMGKKVKCPKCGGAFTAGGAGARSPAEAEEPPPKKSSGVRDRPSGVGQRPPRPREPEDEYEEDEERPRRRRAPDDDDDDERMPARRRRSDMEPHRGTLVLVLGIISVTMAVLSLVGFCCPPLGFTPVIGLPLGIVSWVLGQRDLRRMNAGEMDPEGQGTTTGGWVCGIIGTILNALILIAVIVIIVIYVAFSVAVIQSMPQPPTGPGPRPPGKLEFQMVPLLLQDYLPGVHGCVAR